MDKTKIRIILVLVSLLAFSFSLFGVLYAEELKQLSKAKADRDEILSGLEETDRLRREYYESIRAQREELSRQMERSKAEYEDLLAKQPDLVAEQKQSVTKTVEEVVPVTTTQTVSKPKSTKKTKSS